MKEGLLIHIKLYYRNIMMMWKDYNMAVSVSKRNEENLCKRFILLAIRDGGSGLEDGTDQRLKPASPAPRSGTEALDHHRTVLVEECAESLAGNQNWCLGGKDMKLKG